MQAGIGLKADHYTGILERCPDVGFFEIHAENAMAAGGPTHHWLERLRAERPFSVHGVGLSLGSAEGLCEAHLGRFKAVVDRYQPILVSEHVSFAMAGGSYINQLAPIPYTQESLENICRNVDRVQTVLGRPILMENPSSYFAWDVPRDKSLSEPAFLAALSRKTGCEILLDVNNVYVSAQNLGFDARDYLESLSTYQVRVGEIHLAGHVVKETAQGTLRIDDHGSAVCSDVWQLYEQACRLFGDVPTLIEWDTDIPALATLVAEAEKANQLRALALGDAKVRGAEICHA